LGLGLGRWVCVRARVRVPDAVRLEHKRPVEQGDLVRGQAEATKLWP
jgi:hypothetical protein